MPQTGVLARWDQEPTYLHSFVEAYSLKAPPDKIENSLHERPHPSQHAAGPITYLLLQGFLNQQGRQGLEKHVHFIDDENKAHMGA